MYQSIGSRVDYIMPAADTPVVNIACANLKYVVPKGTLELFPMQFFNKGQDDKCTTEPAVHDKGP
jgi:hypothetical protein